MLWVLGFLLDLQKMGDLQNEIIPQVHVMVDIFVEQQFGSIIDYSNDPNFCGSAIIVAFVDCVGYPITIIDANVFTTIVTNEVLWSLLAK